MKVYADVMRFFLNGKPQEGVKLLIIEKKMIIVALVLAVFFGNVSPETYNALLDWHRTMPWWLPFGHFHDGKFDFSLRWLMRDPSLAVFFLHTGAEIREEISHYIILAGPRPRPNEGVIEQIHWTKNVFKVFWQMLGMTIFGTLGGFLVPMMVFAGLTYTFAPELGLMNAMLMAAATDIVFAYNATHSVYLPRIIEGLEKPLRHPVVKKVLKLAVFDDLLTLIGIAVLLTDGVRLGPLLAGLLFCFYVARKMRQRGVEHFGWYLLFAPVLFLSFQVSHIEPAISTVILPFLVPVKDANWHGVHAREDEDATDTLNSLERFMAPFAEVAVFFFVFSSAGIHFWGQWHLFKSAAFVIPLFSLVVGKTLGIPFMMWLHMLFTGSKLPEGIRWRDVFVMAATCGNGFTVSIFVATQALTGIVQASAILGAACSMPVSESLKAFFVKILKVKPIIPAPLPAEAQGATA